MNTDAISRIKSISFNTTTTPRSLSLYQGNRLHPDLPAKDCLYIFANFLSYWKAPDEDPDTVPASCLQEARQLIDAVRSLHGGDRELGIEPTAHILHIKYRWPLLVPKDAEEDGFYARGKQPKHAPPPFEVLDEPVIKCELLPTQQFEPVPAAAVFAHISEHMKSPPKQIIYSWIGSRFTAGHLAILSDWCAACSPPIVVLSPQETRCRLALSLSQSLGQALNMSLDPAADTSSLADLADTSADANANADEVALAPPSTWTIGKDTSRIKSLQERHKLLKARLREEGETNQDALRGSLDTTASLEDLLDELAGVAKPKNSSSLGRDLVSAARRKSASPRMTTTTKSSSASKLAMNPFSHKRSASQVQ